MTVTGTCPSRELAQSRFNDGTVRGPAPRTVGGVPRRPRYELPPGAAHVVSRGNRRDHIFLDQLDYDLFLGDLATTARRFDWACMAYALLPNHFHLVVDAPVGALSGGLHWLNGRHARRFNVRHGYVGHLFQERFWAEAAEDDSQLLTTIAYTVLNTWRARLAAHPLACRRTSHRALVGLDPAPRFLAVDRVLGLFDRNRDRARNLYEAFVEGAMSRPDLSR